MLIPVTIGYVFAGLFGLVWGSFLNVCITRLPGHQSVVKPRSRCPRCGEMICWYDNVPVISFLALRGKCRRCGQRISILYPAVELLTACLFIGAYAEFGATPLFLKAVIFLMLMIIIIFTDLRERIIPHAVTLTGIAAGLVFSVFVPVNDGLIQWILSRANLALPSWLSSLAGAIAGGLFGAGLLYAVAWFFRHFGDPEKEYLGFGDVMLMMVVGVFLGVPLTYVAILLGSVVGMVVAVVSIAIKRSLRNYAWPYGSFLAAAALYAFLFGQALITGYLRWAKLR